MLAGSAGWSIAALAGFILGGAAAEVPVVLDGVIAGAAALVAAALAPEVTGPCFAGHRSSEPGVTPARWPTSGSRPLVDLDLRLGEGTGALLAAAPGAERGPGPAGVATFDSAGVTDKQ